MPALVDPHDVYAAARPGQMSSAVSGAVAPVYVPNSKSDTVDVIDPATFKVIGHFDVGHEPQHVTPSYDLKTLWVLADLGDSLTRIDPVTGEKKETIPVTDPYNMYYTPDGKFAVVVAERKRRLDFREPHSMKLVSSLPVAGEGVDHMEFAANGRYLIASCEFSGQMLKVDVAHQKVVGTLKLSLPGQSHGHGHDRDHPMPQDVRIAPDGSVFFAA